MSLMMSYDDDRMFEKAVGLEKGIEDSKMPM